MSSAIRLVVFDWDGTLMDSQAHIVNSIQRTVTDLALPERADHQVSDIIGLGLREAIVALYPEADGVFCQRFTERYRYHYFAGDLSQPFAGGEGVLEHLEQEGYLLAVATGKGRSGLDRVLQSTGFGRFFHLTRCADETRSKPHPEMLHQIMDTLGVEARQTLMVGDSEYDMLMARNAGAHCLSVSYGVHARERLQICGPLGCIDAITDLPDWLRKYNVDRSAGA